MSTKKVSSNFKTKSLRNLFIMILEWGNTSFYMQFQKNTGA